MADAAVTAEATATPASLGTEYTVVEGDTLWAIAEQFGVAPEVVLAANPGLLADSLFPGDVILIPDPNQPLPPPEADARVQVDATGLRLRAEPSLQGQVVEYLAALTPLDVIGRSADDAWLRVLVPSGAAGWVSAEFVDVFVALADVPVLDPAAIAALPTTVPASPVPLSTPALGTPTPLAAFTPLPPGSYAYISNVTAAARDIYLRGQALGNRPNVFSKVGDSITVSSVFMQPIGAGRYNLQAYADLQPVIDYFLAAEARAGLNSFANPSLAAKVGWRARAVLSPASADPAACQPGETPLACEYRLVRPAVALIMLGTNDVPYTPEAEFDADLRRVIETTIEWGIVPVISTIPPLYRTGLEGRAEALNAIIVRLAHEYGVPLWDFYAALQGLPNTGMAGDGVHPSWAPAGHSADFTPEYLQYGMTVRNLTGLYALDAVWRQVILGAPAD